MLIRTPGEDDWLAAHLYFDGDIYAEKADRILLEVVAPVVADCLAEGWISGWFFIRYFDQGAHLRVRFLGRPGILHTEVRLRVLDAVRTPAGKELVERVAWMPYEPEVERYGGPEGVGRAEEWFHSSSEAASSLLRKVPPGDRAARLGKAMLAMLVMLHSYRRDRLQAAHLAHSYGRNYLRNLVPDPEQQEKWFTAFEEGWNRQADHLADYVEAAWESLAAGEELTRELDRYLADTRETAGKLRALAARRRLHLAGEATDDWSRMVLHLVPSYLHMMNNRLGVSIREECYLSELIFLTLVGDPPAPQDTPSKESKRERVSTNLQIH